AYSLILITVAGVLGLFITNQTIQFIQSLDTLPAWSQKIALGCITLFGLLLLYVIWQLFRNVVRLTRSPGIHRKAIRQLEQRQELQKLAREKHTAARTALIKYLKDYPTTARAEQTCRKAGMRPDEWKQITKAKAALTSNDHAASPDDWVDSFVQDFQT